MDHMDDDLKALICHGKSQGFLTYDEVNAYLPDEAVTPEKLDNLLVALDELGIELVADAPGSGKKTNAAAEDDDATELAIPADQLPKLSDDPIRMYLSQMAEIPLLTANRKSRWRRRSK